MAYWKVVAFLNDDGQPSATAYIVDQVEELARDEDDLGHARDGLDAGLRRRRGRPARRTRRARLGVARARRQRSGHADRRLAKEVEAVNQYAAVM